jgi:Flp pilus assembly protein protease CpaA
MVTDLNTLLVAMLFAAAVGMMSVLAILIRQRQEAAAASFESPFAASTEGEKRCGKCGMGNLWTDARCVSCGYQLPG